MPPQAECRAVAARHSPRFDSTATSQTTFATRRWGLQCAFWSLSDRSLEAALPVACADPVLTRPSREAHRTIMIRFQNVTKVYPRSLRPALDDVSIEIDRGEFVFVVGQSGSGKSTLLRIALREELATSGEVLVSGQDLASLGARQVPRLRRTMGAVFQDFRLLPGKTVHQNVAFALQVIGKPNHVIRTAVPETLEMVGLEGLGKRLPNQLSGGEQQRVAIARAVVNKPQILLADEPTGNLDPRISLDIVHLLERINQAGTTVLMATHDAAIVNALGKRVIELGEGQVLRDEAKGSYQPPKAGQSSSPDGVPGSTWDPVDDELADLLPADDATDAAHAAEAEAAAEARSDRDEEEKR